jgi:hypothetical protein
MRCKNEEQNYKRGHSFSYENLLKMFWLYKLTFNQNRGRLAA